MLSVSSLNKLIKYGIVFVSGLVCAWVATPLWREAVMAFNQGEYGLLVEQCDNAMRDHFQAKEGSKHESGERTRSSLDAAEVGLIVCQDYDLYQKRLMQWGLREAELAQMRLVAIEERASDLEAVIETHEIRF